MLAVEALVTCAVARTAAPSQIAAVESQKVTWPFVIGAPLPVTVAVSSTGCPASTLDEDSVSTVVVLSPGLACAEKKGQQIVAMLRRVIKKPGRNCVKEKWIYFAA